jgi:hypothetical protein
MSVGWELAIIEVFEHPAKDARTTMEKMFLVTEAAEWYPINIHLCLASLIERR